MNKIQLTKEQLGQIAAGVLFGGLFIYGYLVYFWLPTARTIEENTKKVASIEADINKAKMQKAKYKNLEVKLASLREEKEAAQKKLPRERKLPDLLRTITALSKRHKVDVQSITPSGSAPVEYFTRVSYIINLRGDYHDVGRFLTALGLEERILTSENLTMSAAAGSEKSVNAQFILVAYQYNG
ncbi:MAG: type 4a pilus biogenesis protein PilO [Elusimicrobiales bacterium]|nr:type 4a pilus biogenesis protein PilO [Elusimicrobiales bacterium]